MLKVTKVTKVTVFRACVCVRAHVRARVSKKLCALNCALNRKNGECQEIEKPSKPCGSKGLGGTHSGTRTLDTLIKSENLPFGRFSRGYKSHEITFF